MSKNLLFVCEDIRAKSGAKGFRARAIIKYLSRMGWHVSVLSVAGADANDLADLGDIEVIGGFVQQQESRLQRGLKRLMDPYHPFGQWWKASEADLLAVAIKVNGFEVILTTSPPHSLQAIGMKIHKKLGVPLVVDLRDDWKSNHRTRYLTALHRWVSDRDEAKCMKLASKVVLNTAVVKSRFEARYPDQAVKFKVVTNGFEDLPTTPELGPHEEIQVCYAGDGYHGFMEKRLKGLLDELEASGSTNQVSITTMGGGWSSEAGNRSGWVHLGNLSPEVASARIAEADLLILAMPPGEREPSGTVPLKTYSYLATGRTVVYLGERGSTTDLLASFDGCHSLGREGWKGFGAWLVAHKPELKKMHDRSEVGRLHIREKVGELDAVLREVVGD